MDSALPLLPLPETERPVGCGPKPKPKKRGPALAHCVDCNHPIWDEEYASRPGGPRGRRCGGPIRRPRQPSAPKPPAAPKAGRRPVEDVKDQCALFEIVVIKVRA